MQFVKDLNYCRQKNIRNSPYRLQGDAQILKLNGISHFYASLENYQVVHGLIPTFQFSQHTLPGYQPKTLIVLSI